MAICLAQAELEAFQQLLSENSFSARRTAGGINPAKAVAGVRKLGIQIDPLIIGSGNAYSLCHDLPSGMKAPTYIFKRNGNV